MQAYRNLMTRLVMQESDCLRRLGGLHSSGHRAFFTAKLAARLITVQQRFADAGVTNDFVTQITGDSFCSLAPKHNPLLQVQNAQP